MKTEMKKIITELTKSVKTWNEQIERDNPLQYELYLFIENFLKNNPKLDIVFVKLVYEIIKFQAFRNMDNEWAHLNEDEIKNHFIKGISNGLYTKKQSKDIAEILDIITVFNYQRWYA